VHARGVKMADGVDLRRVAKGTPGFSGADLANLINEAALLAGRTGRACIEQQDLERARDKVMMGVERKSLQLRSRRGTRRATRSSRPCCRTPTPCTRSASCRAGAPWA
jgi:ATP-dependent Zn protease